MADEPTPPHKTTDANKLGAIGAVLIAIFGAGGAGTAWLNQRSDVVELKSKLSLAESKVAGVEAELSRVNALLQIAKKCDQPIAGTTPRSLVGQWGGDQDGTVVVTNDDGKEFRAGLDGNGYKHDLVGKYVDGSTIVLTTTRTDPTGCKVAAPATINIIDSNRIRYSQRGFDGCGVIPTTGSHTWHRE